jgi:hypothetical protein
MHALRLMVIVAAICQLAMLGSCDKLGGAMKSINGKVAGQVLNSAGHGRGYVSVVLEPVDGSDPFVTTTEERGNFMLEEIPPGEYKLLVKRSGLKSDELPSDTPTIKLGPGRTQTQNITLNDVAPAT